MSRYVHKIYPKATPLSGLITTITDQEALEGTGWRVELNGTGSGQIVINRYNAKCTSAAFADGNYVQVLDTVLNKAVAGWWMPAGTADLVSQDESGAENLTVSGPGSIAYFGRDEWLPEAYVAPGYRPGVGDASNSPRADGLWHWPNTRLGAIIERAILEGQDPDRPDNEIPDLTYDFVHGTDSAGDAFLVYTNDYTQPIGANYLDTLSDVIRLGLTCVMQPNLLMHLYQNQYGTDRHSSTFASGKVLFKKGVNIAADLDRTLNPSVRVKTLVVKGRSDLPADYVIVQDSGGVGEAFLDYGITDDPTLLTAAGNANLAARRQATDTAAFPILKPGNDPLNGRYVPSWPGDGGHFWIGDTVTLHTGTGALDYNNESIRVWAITQVLLDNGDDQINVELGSRFFDFSHDTSVEGGVPGSTPCTCGPLPAPTPICTEAQVVSHGESAVHGGGTQAIVVNGTEPNAALVVFGRTTGIPTTGSVGYRLHSTDTANTAVFDLVDYVGYSDMYLSVWVLRNPPAGGDPGSVGYVVGLYPWVGYYLRNVDQTTPIGATAGTSVQDMTTTRSVGIAGAGKLVLDAVIWVEKWDLGCVATPDPARTNVYAIGYSGFGDPYPSIQSGSAQDLTTVGWTDLPVSCAAGGPWPWNGTPHLAAAVNPSSSPDPFCRPALIYGGGYDPSTGITGYYIPFGSTVPAPTAAEVPFDNSTAGLPGSPDNVQDAIEALDGEIVTDHGALTGLTPDDDHPQYQLRSEKAAASGYASLDSTTKVPTVQLGTGTADGTKVLKGDRTWGTASTVATLDDLTDVQITSPANLDELRYEASSGLWKNDARIWRPLMDGYGNVVVDSGTGEAIMVLT